MNHSAVVDRDLRKDTKAMSAPDSTRTKMFTQVARTSKAVEQGLLDPLSMFAMQQNAQPQEEEPKETISARIQSVTTSSLGSAVPLAKDDLKTPSVQQPVKKVESRPSTRSISPTPTAPFAVPTTTAPRQKSSLVPQPPPGADDEILLKSLTGEQKIMSILDSFISVATGEVISGTLFMTNYRLVFIPSSTDLTSIAITNPSVHSYLQVPIAAIDKIDREKRAKDVLNTAISVVIHCKDFRQLRITIRSSNKSGGSDYDIERAINLIAAYAFPNNMRYLFAFTHRFGGIQAHDLAEPYDPALEFSRMGVLDNPTWRVSNANATYKLCNTYPQWLVVPAALSDDDLHAVAGFRSGHRLPAMCWADRESGASMWRCSQPKAGVSGSCSQDERMLDLIARSCLGMHARHRLAKKHSNEGLLYIVDCRSRASAMANRAAGAGYESQTNYPNTRLDFYSISNIHAVRDMYKALGSFILAPSGSSVDLNFTKQFEDTQWLNSIRSILKASHDTATFLNNGAPVLVHCSHGWDRTAQVCALAQLMLDPYYRTFDGFKVLVEKEWVSFGHAFQMRCAHSQDKATRAEDQVSQVMIQFLDCVWQVHRQCPQYFEFNSRYILTVADHIYSGRFGTFLFSSDYERDLYNARQACPDVWSYLNCNRAVLANPLYTNPDRVLLPPASQLLRNVTIWSDYFLRWSSAPTVAPIPLQLSQHLYSDGLCRPLPVDELHEQPYKPVDAEGTPLACYADFEVSAAITSADCWEAAYRVERMKRISAEVQERELADRQQETIDRLMQLLREQAPDLSEEAITAALSNTATKCGQDDGEAPASELDSGLVELPPERRRSSFGSSSTVPPGAGAVDPLLAGVTNGHAAVAPVPVLPVPQAKDDYGSPSAGIIINEPFRALSVPSLPPVMSTSASHEDMLSADTPLIDVDTPPVHGSDSNNADDASFYPEDEIEAENGVSV